MSVEDDRIPAERTAFSLPHRSRKRLWILFTATTARFGRDPVSALDARSHLPENLCKSLSLPRYAWQRIGLAGRLTTPDRQGCRPERLQKQKAQELLSRIKRRGGACGRGRSDLVSTSSRLWSSCAIRHLALCFSLQPFLDGWAFFFFRRNPPGQRIANQCPKVVWIIRASPDRGEDIRRIVLVHPLRGEPE